MKAEFVNLAFCGEWPMTWEAFAPLLLVVILAALTVLLTLRAGTRRG